MYYLGVIGLVIVALCSFTPILPLLLDKAGVETSSVRLDVFLLPLLGFFIILTVIGLWRRRRSS